MSQKPKVTISEHEITYTLSQSSKLQASASNVQKLTFLTQKYANPAVELSASILQSQNLAEEHTFAERAKSKVWNDQGLLESEQLLACAESGIVKQSNLDILRELECLLNQVKLNGEFEPLMEEISNTVEKREFTELSQIELLDYAFGNLLQFLAKNEADSSLVHGLKYIEQIYLQLINIKSRRQQAQEQAAFELDEQLQQEDLQIQSQNQQLLQEEALIERLEKQLKHYKESDDELRAQLENAIFDIETLISNEKSYKMQIEQLDRQLAQEMEQSSDTIQRSKRSIKESIKYKQLLQNQNLSIQQNREYYQTLSNKYDALMEQNFKLELQNEQLEQEIKGEEKHNSQLQCEQNNVENGGKLEDNGYTDQEPEEEPFNQQDFDLNCEFANALAALVEISTLDKKYLESNHITMEGLNCLISFIQSGATATNVITFINGIKQFRAVKEEPGKSIGVEVSCEATETKGSIGKEAISVYEQKLCVFDLMKYYNVYCDVISKYNVGKRTLKAKLEHLMIEEEQLLLQCEDHSFLWNYSAEDEESEREDIRGEDVNTAAEQSSEALARSKDKEVKKEKPTSKENNFEQKETQRADNEPEREEVSELIRQQKAYKMEAVEEFSDAMQMEESEEKSSMSNEIEAVLSGKSEKEREKPECEHEVIEQTDVTIQTDNITISRNVQTEDVKIKHPLVRDLYNVPQFTPLIMYLNEEGYELENDDSNETDELIDIIYQQTEAQNEENNALAEVITHDSLQGHDSKDSHENNVTNDRETQTQSEAIDQEQEEQSNHNFYEHMEPSLNLLEYEDTSDLECETDITAIEERCTETDTEEISPAVPNTEQDGHELLQIKNHASKTAKNEIENELSDSEKELQETTNVGDSELESLSVDYIFFSSESMQNEEFSYSEPNNFEMHSAIDIQTETNDNARPESIEVNNLQNETAPDEVQAIAKFMQLKAENQDDFEENGEGNSNTPVEEIGIQTDEDALPEEIIDNSGALPHSKYVREESSQNGTFGSEKQLVPSNAESTKVKSPNTVVSSVQTEQQFLDEIGVQIEPQLVSSECEVDDNTKELSKGIEAGSSLPPAENIQEEYYNTDLFIEETRETEKQEEVKQAEVSQAKMDLKRLKEIIKDQDIGAYIDLGIKNEGNTLVIDNRRQQLNKVKFLLEPQETDYQNAFFAKQKSHLINIFKYNNNEGSTLMKNTSLLKELEQIDKIREQSEVKSLEAISNLEFQEEYLNFNCNVAELSSQDFVERPFKNFIIKDFFLVQIAAVIERQKYGLQYNSKDQIYIEFTPNLLGTTFNPTNLNQFVLENAPPIIYETYKQFEAECIEETNYLKKQSIVASPYDSIEYVSLESLGNYKEKPLLIKLLSSELNIPVQLISINNSKYLKLPISIKLQSKNWLLSTLELVLSQRQRSRVSHLLTVSTYVTDDDQSIDIQQTYGLTALEYNYLPYYLIQFTQERYKLKSLQEEFILQFIITFTHYSTSNADLFTMFEFLFFDEFDYEVGDIFNLYLSIRRSMNMQLGDVTSKISLQSVALLIRSIFENWSVDRKVALFDIFCNIYQKEEQNAERIIPILLESYSSYRTSIFNIIGRVLPLSYQEFKSVLNSGNVYLSNNQFLCLFYERCGVYRLTDEKTFSTEELEELFIEMQIGRFLIITNDFENKYVEKALKQKLNTVKQQQIFVEEICEKLCNEIEQIGSIEEEERQIECLCNECTSYLAVLDYQKCQDRQFDIIKVLLDLCEEYSDSLVFTRLLQAVGELIKEKQS